MYGCTYHVHTSSVLVVYVDIVLVCSQRLTGESIHSKDCKVAWLYERDKEMNNKYANGESQSERGRGRGGGE
mgnify:CR=1 FL=1